jgi:hypothetical protein
MMMNEHEHEHEHAKTIKPRKQPTLAHIKKRKRNGPIAYGKQKK